MAKSDKKVQKEFREAVNMDADELKEWLETDESKSVGQSDDGGESKGHESGRRIVESSRRTTKTSAKMTSTTCAAW